MKKCHTCGQELMVAFFNEQSGDDCVFCADDRITLARSQKHDFEEVYVSNKGIYIETDPVDNTVLWISVFVKEIDNEDFEKGNW